jgi:hypothetical protein
MEILGILFLERSDHSVDRAVAQLMELTVPVAYHEKRVTVTLNTTAPQLLITIRDDR